MDTEELAKGYSTWKTSLIRGFVSFEDMRAKFEDIRQIDRT